ncbi:hypothetical protein ACG7TL_005191 [Trametes sanguinea]
MALNGVLNVVHLLLIVLSFVTFEESTSVITIFTEPLTAILICRFLLSLHSANLKAMDQDSDALQSGESPDNAGTLRFASTIVTSMGGNPEFDGDIATGEDRRASDVFPADSAE